MLTYAGYAGVCWVFDCADSLTQLIYAIDACQVCVAGGCGCGAVLRRDVRANKHPAACRYSHANTLRCAGNGSCNSFCVRLLLKISNLDILVPEADSLPDPAPPFACSCCSLDILPESYVKQMSLYILVPTARYFSTCTSGGVKQMRVCCSLENIVPPARYFSTES
jgi:hypothetical protein